MSIFWDTVLPIMSEKQITQVELAKSLNKEKSTINHWIKYDRVPPANYALQIADFLGEDLRYLLTGEKTESYEFIERNEYLKAIIDLLKDKDTKFIETALIGLKAIIEFEGAKESDYTSDTA